VGGGPARGLGGRARAGAGGTAGHAFRVVPILDGNWGDTAAAAVTPDGRTLYVADESQNAVAAISLQP